MNAGQITQAVVLGAGLGTRLRPMTGYLPKPGVPLRHEPVAAHTVAHLAAAGVTRVAVNTHHLAESLERLLRQHAPAGVALHFSRETELLGTGGGVRAAWALLDPTQPLLVMNGDILFQPDLQAAIVAHRERAALATMIVREHPDAHQLGAIETNAQGKVVRLLGTPREQAVQGVYMFTGVHLLAPEAFRELPDSGCIIRESYRRWVDAARPVYAVASDARFRDIGTHAEYLAAHLDALEDQARGEPIHPEARLGDGAVVTRSWVGARACVAPGVRLDECVVWPDTNVDQSASRAILGPFGVLRVDLD